MKRPDIEKLAKIAKKCYEVHNNIKSDIDVDRAVQKGYQIAYDLMILANKTKDKALFENTYKLSQGLLPESSILDSQILFKLKEYKTKFLEKVVVLLIDNPNTILNPTKQQLKSNLNNATDQYEQQNLTKRLDNINEGIGEIQLKRGIVCPESTAFFKKVHNTKIAAANKYYEDLKSY